MNEKDLLEQLKKSADQITPPDSLSPEAIEKLLEEKKRTETAAPLPEKKKHISIYRLGGLAAAFAVAIIGSWQAGRLSGIKNVQYSESAVIISDTESSTAASTDKLSEQEATSQPKAATGQETASVTGNLETASVADKATANDSESDPESVLDTVETLPDQNMAAAGEDAVSSVSRPADEDSSAQADDAADTAQAAASTEASSQATADDAAPLPALDPADSYETIHKALWDAFGSSATDDVTLYDTGATMEIAEESADMAAGQFARSESAVSNASGSKNDFSQTNVQEAGVDEGDYVKTDGDYIYILKRSGSVIILSASEGTLTNISGISLPLNEDVKEMYVDGNRLSVITSEYYTEMDNSSENVIASRSGTRTKLYTWDISNRETPKLLGTVTQDGSYSQSRKNGDYIYLFSQFSPTLMENYEDSLLVPITSRGELQASEIYLPEHLNYSTYLVASSVSIQDPETIVDQKAVVSVASTFYASTENIYIANEDWSDSTTHTELMKLHYENGIITGTAVGNVEGYLNDSFSLNEYNGYLRVVTTSYDENYNETNGLYILDESLNLVGAITDLAPDETIRSARFMGDTGYFVTFRQTDPLFSVDLSDPENPRILGDLKISGFSTYLHFYSDTLLLGLGYEADENTGVTTGLKLSMFDISDPTNVTEVSKLVLKGITWCDSLEDYKSILIDPEKNIFGFTCDNRYLLFSYDEEKGFVKEFIYDFYNDIISESQTITQPAGTEETEIETNNGTDSDTEKDSGSDTDDASAEDTDEIAVAETDTAALTEYFGYDYSNDTTTRGLFINNTLYLVRPNAVTTFDMENEYEEIGRLNLN